MAVTSSQIDPITGSTVERIRLDTVTEQQQVTEDVRKEQIELDDPTGTATR